MPDLRLSYLYMEAETQRRYDQVCTKLHWSAKDLVSQCIQAFLKVNRDYYVECGYKDAEARGMEIPGWYKTLRDESEDDLKPYVAGRPAFGRAPLDDMPDVQTGSEFKRTYNVLSMGGFNLVLLKTCKLVDLGPMSQVVSRIVAHHFQHYWPIIYAPQLELDEKCLLPERKQDG